VNKNVLNEFDELVKENILSPVILWQYKYKSGTNKNSQRLRKIK
jgi:hypothetical protein